MGEGVLFKKQMLARIALDSPLSEIEDINAFYPTEDGDRTFLMIACSLGSITLVQKLLQSPKINIDACSPSDGFTALHCACQQGADTKIVALLMRSGASMGLKNAQGKLPSDILRQSEPALRREAIAEQEQALLSSDDFRMYSFKIAHCPIPDEAHDWNVCPYLHPGEKARRRDPRIWLYHPFPCPEYRKGHCKRGDACPFAHGVFEAHLHPCRYRTQLCKEGIDCNRGVCFFAHNLKQLREPPSSLHALINATSKRDGDGLESPASILAGMVSESSSCCDSPTLNMSRRSSGSLVSVEPFSTSPLSCDDGLSGGVVNGRCTALAAAAAIRSMQHQKQQTAKAAEEALQRLKEIAGNVLPSHQNTAQAAPQQPTSDPEFGSSFAEADIAALQSVISVLDI